MGELSDAWLAWRNANIEHDYAIYSKDKMEAERKMTIAFGNMTKAISGKRLDGNDRKAMREIENKCDELEEKANKLRNLLVSTDALPGPSFRG